MATLGAMGTPYALLVLCFWGFVFFRSQRFAGPVFFVVALLLLGTLPRLWPEPMTSPMLRASCRNNMMQIAMAIQKYESAFGTLPPAYSTDEEGKPLHSWRVLLLPFFEKQNLYNAIHLDEPWDSPSNRRLWRKVPGVYRCPGCQLGRKLGALSDANVSASYYAVVGPQTAWTGAKGLPLKEFASDKSKRLLLVEAYQPKRCWMEPREFSTEEVLSLLCAEKSLGHLHAEDALLTNSVRTYGNSLGFVDGSSFWSAEVFDESHARNLLTPNDNRKIKQDQRPGQIRYFRAVQLGVVYKWKRIYSFTTFVLLSLLPLTQFRRRNVLAKVVG